MPDFTLPIHSGGEFTLSSHKKPIVLFFYPRDNTPGCTIENQDFAKLYPKFTKLGYDVIGISRDTVKSHCTFANKFALPFPLLADPDETVCKLFNVMKDKKMYGKDVRGIERSTFIIDASKKIIKEWRKVKVDDHAQEVLSFIESL
jgi:thioredoxin-dependent peroxiredoxin